MTGDYDGSTVLWVLGGVVAAVLLAVTTIRWVPEHRAPVDADSDVSSIDYSSLAPGANLADLERGRVYYMQLCSTCHGVRGDGYGEWAYRVTPKPADLTAQRVRQRSDAYLFEVISEGQLGTSMLGWKERLSEIQRRQVIAYLRHLGVSRSRRAES